MDRAENGKRKNIFFFLQPFLLSCFTASDESSLSLYLVHKYKQYLFVLALVSVAPRQGTCPHHQAYCLSAKKTPSIEKVSLITNQQLAIAQWSVREEIAFLVFDMCG